MKVKTHNFVRFFFHGNHEFQYLLYPTGTSTYPTAASGSLYGWNSMKGLFAEGSYSISGRYGFSIVPIEELNLEPADGTYVYSLRNVNLGGSYFRAGLGISF